MKDRFFLDTNILVYYFQKENSEKKIIARQLINESIDSIVISTQILGELFNVLFRLDKNSIKSSEIIKKCLDIFETIPVNPQVILKSLELHKKYGFSYYDSQVIAAALYANCTILYTEDLQHNQLIENRLRIINPFKK